MTQNKSKKVQISGRPFKFYKVSQIHFLNTHQICMYIKKLHQIIRTQQNYLQKYKKRVKKVGLLTFDHLLFLTGSFQVGKTSDTQQEVEEVLPKLNADEERDKKVSSFLDDIKSAATEGFIQQMGMIYEPTSGMYYHPTTGYYYNAVRFDLWESFPISTDLCFYYRSTICTMTAILAPI